MAKKTPELLSYVMELREQGLSSRQIAERIRNELGENITDRTIRNWLRNEISEGLKAVKKFSKEIEYTNPFEFEGNDIVFYVKSQDGEGVDRIALPISIVEHIWTDYVSHGANLTGQQIMEKYELNPRAWNILKSRLGLYKSSNIIPDWLLEKIEKEKGEEETEIKINEVSYKAAISKYKSKIAKKYRTAKEKEYEKAITKLYEIENFLEMLKDYIDNYEPEKFTAFDDIIKNHKLNNETLINDTLYTVLTDIHIGKEKTDDVIQRLKMFVNEVIKRPEKNIKIFILGDLVEDLTVEGKHPGMLQNMDGPYGFDLIMKTVNVFENVITKIYEAGKTVEVAGIAGNHDSYDKKNNLDGTAGYVIYELIKRGIKNIGVKLEYYREIWNSVDTEDFCFILNHGTGPQTNKKPKDILWEFGDNKKENIILQGDKHHAELNNVSNNGTRILCPSLAGEGAYSRSLGISSYTGFTIIKKGYNGKPKVEFIFLD